MMNEQPITRTSWKILGEAVSQGHLVLREGDLPYQRQLQWPDQTGTDVTFSHNFHWYQVSDTLPVCNEEKDKIQKLAQGIFKMSRIAITSQGVSLLADVPSGPAERLTDALSLWRADHEQALHWALHGETRADCRFLPPSNTCSPRMQECREMLQRYLEGNWLLAEKNSGGWRMIRQPEAPRWYPANVEVTVDTWVTTFAIESPTRDKSRTNSSGLATTCFILRSNLRPHVARRRLDDGRVRFSFAIPSGLLHSVHLQQGVQALLHAYRSGVDELNVLSDRKIAKVYLYLQESL
jgi:hypothetical protein